MINNFIKLLNSIIIGLLTLNINLYSDDVSGYEIGVANYSNSRILRVRIYPVSITFTGAQLYDLKAENEGDRYHYINGANLDRFYFDLQDSGGTFGGWDLDGANTNGSCVGAVGKGINRIDFYWDGLWQDSCLIEHDTLNPGDLNFEFWDNNSNPRIVYFWATCDTASLPQNRKLESWHTCYMNRNKVYGNYFYRKQLTHDNNLFPFDFRQDAIGEYQDTLIVTNRIGLLVNNLTIDTTVITRTWENSYGNTRLDAPTQIIVSQNCTLKINGDDTLTVKYDEYNNLHNDWYTKLIVKPNAVFQLNSGNALAKFEQTNWLILDCNSKLIIGNGSKVIMDNGSRFCNLGGTIEGGPGSFVNLGRIRYMDCISPCSDNIVKDSIKFILEKDASLEIPDSTTYFFEGNETVLLCDSGSTIKLGKNSKLVFNDGARIKAKYTKFTSYDSTETWDGIYMNDFAYDTLQYCTIENAVNGVNKEDLTTSLNDPATEISNCTFSNTTQTQLLNMIYVNGGRNVMIRNCSSSSSISNGFESGLIIEYTDAGEVNVIDCDIDYVTTGISIIQSSPYVARNTITGTGNDGAGIFLDNSNGTIEYNNVSGFDIAVQLYYSSPYMLKNTFNSTSVSCADFTASSVPVIRPVISGTTSRWLGGNNFFTGSSVEAGIRFTDGGYPLMDSGYNVIDVGNSNYIEGSPDDLLYARVNNWTDDPPNSGQFAVGGAGIDYSNPFNGEPLPPANYYDLYSIGFGFYDTVYYDYIGDNPSPEELFMQAYLKEMTGYYSDAVTLYKIVISEYKTSKYAVSSLSRIFNCLEKAHSNNSVYNAIKAYYDNLKSSNNYPARLREVAEDFAIKSKVKMGFIEDAISDYQTIISNNPNTSKGFHAQINKLCLENMSGGDMFTVGNNPTNEHYKAGLLSLITGKKANTNKSISNSIPKQFKLYQNYPNPFNPKTTIKFDIPINGQVSLKVYDIAGRELFSMNEYKSAGSYEVIFDGTNFASGLYFYKIESGSNAETKKMVLLK